jgi:RHS repeat-associated protein
MLLLVLSGLAVVEFPAQGKLTGAPDAAWNLNTRTANGSPATFGVNNLNQNTTTPFGAATYDLNGNMTQRGDYRFEYDAENQLVRLYRDYLGTLYQRTDFVYDGLGRRKQMVQYTWGSGAWNQNSHTRYIHDGRRVIQERNQNNTPTVSYTRGPDLSGSMEGAGGIGGLLARSSGYSGGQFTTHNFYHADGGGNITAMVNSSQGLVASYTYDPFGRPLSSSGSLATANVYRFSSKEIHANTGFYYYGFRYYDPLAQRWINRDPIAKEGVSPEY